MAMSLVRLLPILRGGVAQKRRLIMLMAEEGFLASLKTQSKRKRRKTVCDGMLWTGIAD